jgi:hypothetical protein
MALLYLAWMGIRLMNDDGIIAALIRILRQG